MYLLTADSLITQAFQALHECPDDDQIGTIPPSAGGAWTGSDVVKKNPESIQEYRAWVETGAQVVIKKFEQLANMGCKDPAKDLLLECLVIPPNDEVWDNDGWGCCVERFPDPLTRAAAKALPSLVHSGDHYAGLS